MHSSLRMAGWRTTEAQQVGGQLLPPRLAPWPRRALGQYPSSTPVYSLCPWIPTLVSPSHLLSVPLVGHEPSHSLPPISLLGLKQQAMVVLAEAAATTNPCNKTCEQYRDVCWCETGLVSCLLWLAEEGRDENTGVKVECGMPPSVREIQNLTSLDGALQGPCRWCQGWVGVLEPGQSGLIGVELRGLLRRI